MKVNYAGCAICDSTWGDSWEEIDGERLFFCCPLCVTQFRNLIARVRRTTGWPAVDAIEIAGDRGGRTATARHGSSTFRCEFAFNSDGELRRFVAV